MVDNTQEYMLTTIDNPYSPVNDFEQWFIYDEIVLQHHTCSLLAKYSNIDIDASKDETKNDIDRAIDAIILNDVTGLYVRVKANETKQKENETN